MIKYFLCIFILFFNCQADLVCRTYNVGHGNFSIVSNGNKHLIVDCGAERPVQWSGDIHKINDVKECLKNATSINIVITHNHDDHYNLLQYLFEGDHKVSDIAPNIFYYGMQYDNNNLKQELEIFFYNALGHDVSIHPIIPNNKIVTDNLNEINLVLMIEYAERRILFTGDANESLLSQLKWDTDEVNSENIELMKNINVLMIPHHGSINSNEFMWLQFIRGNCFPQDNRGFSDFIGIISCNPSLRKSYVSYTTIDFFPRNAETALETAQHSVSFIWRNDQLYGKNSENIYKTNDPIFTTSDVVSTCYTITIFENKKIQVADGDQLFFRTKNNMIVQ